MSLVGVVAANKDFEFIKNIVNKKIGTKITLIKITEKNIENIKNVKCEAIVICKEISEFQGKHEILKQIIKNAKYLIINTDVNLEKEVFSNIRTNIITYGLNGKATLTVSSIGEEDILLCLQRNIEDYEKNIIEPYEVKVEIKDINNKKLYNYLAVYVIFALYKGKNTDNL